MLLDVSLEDEPEQNPAIAQSHPSHADNTGPQPASQDATAIQIMQLLHDIQNPQGLASLLDYDCLPFFYRIDEDVMKFRVM